MTKYMTYITLFLIGILGLIMSVSTYTKVYVESPDKSKTITLYKAFYQINNPYYYIIPYKYNGFFPPKDNFCISTWNMGRDGMTEFTVNWYPSEKQYDLKISVDCIENKLDKNIDKNEFFDEDARDPISGTLKWPNEEHNKSGKYGLILVWYFVPNLFGTTLIWIMAELGILIVVVYSIYIFFVCIKKVISSLKGHSNR